MTTKTTKRYELESAKSGRLIGKYTTRELARNAKRNKAFATRIFDTFNLTFVR